MSISPKFNVDKSEKPFEQQVITLVADTLASLGYQVDLDEKQSGSAALRAKQMDKESLAINVLGGDKPSFNSPMEGLSGALPAGNVRGASQQIIGTLADNVPGFREDLVKSVVAQAASASNVRIGNALVAFPQAAQPEESGAVKQVNVNRAEPGPVIQVGLGRVQFPKYTPNH